MIDDYVLVQYIIGTQLKQSMEKQQAASEK